ncbi:MAG: cytochrome c [Amylibacter sp.]|nr:cytochrome c [Amylibacter sp.]
MNKKLTLLVGGVLIAGIAVTYWNAQNAPTGHSMTPPDTSKISRGDAIVNVTLPAELSGTAKIGEVAFNAKCAACHGTNAAGKNGIGPPFIYKTYKPGHHGDAAFLSAARNGVRSHHWRFGNMPPVEGLTDADVKNIVTYIREVQRENGIN